MEKNQMISDGKKRGFTLIELLVVIAIIAMLLAILMPSLGKAKKVAQSVVCRTKLKQMGLALTLYAENNNGAFVYQDWNAAMAMQKYWFMKVACYLDDVQGANAVGKFMRCPSGLSVRDYHDQPATHWNSFDYGLKSWNSTDSLGNAKPKKITSIRYPAGFATIFDFYYGNKTEGNLGGGSIWHNKNSTSSPWYLLMLTDESDAKFSRPKILRHGKAMNAVFADGAVSALKGEVESSKDPGWTKGPDWRRDLHPQD